MDAGVLTILLTSLTRGSSFTGKVFFSGEQHVFSKVPLLKLALYYKPV